MKKSNSPTLETLIRLEGRQTVSKQYVYDLSSRSDLQKPERDLIRVILANQPERVNVKEFTDKVKAILLPLESKNVGGEYESIVLPDELRGDVAAYYTNIYESPIKTNAGGIHFGNITDAMGQDEIQNYFGHTRIEDMADKDLRRVIEIQSDLYQKGRLDEEVVFAPEYRKFYNEEFNRTHKMKKANIYANKKCGSAREKEVKKLSQYNNPTAHFRMVREEIKKAAQDGKTKLQFPTGETAMRIEGLGSTEMWDQVLHRDRDGEADETIPLETDDLNTESVGMEIADSHGDDWIITHVLGDGKFKAVPKEIWRNFSGDTSDFGLHVAQETFDISGKIDTNNPIYRFYEKEIGRYLKNNHDAHPVIDENGVIWNEVTVHPEYKVLPVLAFSKRITIKHEKEPENTVEFQANSQARDEREIYEIQSLRESRSDRRRNDMFEKENDKDIDI